jgi:hypothetical protein
MYGGSAPGVSSWIRLRALMVPGDFHCEILPF